MSALSEQATVPVPVVAGGGRLEYLSYSSLDLYARCSFAWKRRYLDRVKQPRPPALVFGSAVHSAIEQLALVLAAGAEGTDADGGAIWSRVWAGAVPELQGQPGTTAAALRDLDRQGRALLSDSGLRETLCWLGVRRDEQGPVIERRATLRVAGVPLPLVGYLDLIDSFGVPCDFKTSARAWGVDRAGKERQPRVYLAMLAQQGYADNPERVFRHIVLTKEPVTVTTHETRWTGGDLVRLHRWVQEQWAGIAAGRFPCGGDQWCPCADECPERATLSVTARPGTTRRVQEW